MPQALDNNGGLLSYSDATVASSLERQTPLPQFRYAIRVAAILAAILGDILLIGAAAFTAAFIRFRGPQSTTNELLLVITPVFLLAAATLDCYQIRTLRQYTPSVVRALLAFVTAASFAFAAAFALQVGATYSRLEAGIMLACAPAYLTVGHILYKMCLDRISNAVEPHVVILGSAFDPSTHAAGNAERFIPSERPNPEDPASLERTYALIRHADRVILAFADAEDRMAWAKFVRLIGIDAELVEPDLQNITVLGVNHWEGKPTLIVARGALSFGERALKRIFDLAISLPLLVLVGPLLLLLMLLIKIESPGPAIFAQPRVGRNNRRYRCYKLRSMYADKADLQGNRSTGREDNRITRIGKILRRTSLDEFPQLWNVILGDMSLVGPRPHALGSVAEGALFWKAVPDYWTRHAMRPGITGLAQVRGLRGATLTKRDIEKRVEADLEYINSWSMWLDLKILLKTIRIVIHPNAF